MRKKSVSVASVVLITLILGSSAALGAPVQNPELRTARVEASLPPAGPVPATAVATPAGVGIDELRDCAALVLVGGMLLGLAAAVRRTA